MYSHSRLQTFEQCPRKYKFRYLENIKTGSEGIEAFMGKRVHEALEKLYKDLKLTKLNSLDDLHRFYEQAWEEHWHAQIQVARAEVTPGHYFELGRQCIANYYRRFHPFNQSKTLGLEERVDIKITDGEKSYTLQGYIDRLAWDPVAEVYEIHDYKTSGTVPTQEDADTDRQLALYQLALIQRWPDAKKIRLVWHYLAADKDLESTRTTDDLTRLQAEVVEVIHSIEEELKRGEWAIRQSALCDWCDYKPLCPAWKHEAEVQALPPDAYALDSGVQLVEKYAALEARIADTQAERMKLDTEKAALEAAIYAHMEKEGLAALQGSKHRLVLKADEEWKAPRKGEDPFAWEMLRTTLQNANKLEEASTVNANMLRFAMKRGKWPADLVKSIMSFIQVGAKKSLSLVKK